MIRILALSTLALCAAAPALAADVHIQIAGKDDAVVRQEIRIAARQVCRDAGPGRLTVAVQTCFDETVRDAQGQLVQARASNQASEMRLAQAK